MAKKKKVVDKRGYATVSISKPKEIPHLHPQLESTGEIPAPVSSHVQKSEAISRQKSAAMYEELDNANRNGLREAQRIKRTEHARRSQTQYLSRYRLNISEIAKDFLLSQKLNSFRKGRSRNTKTILTVYHRMRIEEIWDHVTILDIMCNEFVDDTDINHVSASLALNLLRNEKSDFMTVITNSPTKLDVKQQSKTNIELGILINTDVIHPLEYSVKNEKCESEIIDHCEISAKNWILEYQDNLAPESDLEVPTKLNDTESLDNLRSKMVLEIDPARRKSIAEKMGLIHRENNDRKILYDNSLAKLTPEFENTLQLESSDECFSAIEELFQSVDNETIAMKNQPAISSIRVMNLKCPSWTGFVPTALFTQYLKKKFFQPTISFIDIDCTFMRGFSAAIKIKAPNLDFIFEMSNNEVTTTRNDARQYCALRAMFILFSNDIPTISQRLAPAFRDIWNECIADLDLKNENDKHKELDSYQAVIDAVSAKNDIMSVTEIANDFSNVPKTTRQSKSSSKTDSLAWNERTTSPSYRTHLRTRSDLPVFLMKLEIMEIVAKNQIVILSGETGSGKSTQVPHFILEHLQMKSDVLANIICTQPRRISAISLAERVSNEMGDNSGPGGIGSLVGYQGILIRRLESDPNLMGITHVIVDEVHERTLDSDFLLYMLRNLVRSGENPNLHIILMSATIEAEKFSAFFAKSATDVVPCLIVPGKTFPVESKFLEDILTDTGYMLPKPTAQKDASADERWDDYLLEDFSSESIEYLENEVKGKHSDEVYAAIASMDHKQIDFNLILCLVKHIHLTEPSQSNSGDQDLKSILIFLPGLGEIKKLESLLFNETLLMGNKNTLKWEILLLHGSMTTKEQSLVFRTCKRGTRKVIVSTNVAETGITIPDVVYVIDAMRAREIMYNEKRDIKRLVDVIIAKANKKQRSGRAGRVREGISYHLISERAFLRLPDHRPPEMLRLPLEEMCLRARLIMSQPIVDGNDDFQLASLESIFASMPDPPPPRNVEKAVLLLKLIGAIDSGEYLTPLGRFLAKVPVDVRIGKILLHGIIFRCLDPILTICAIISLGINPLQPPGAQATAFTYKNILQDNSDLVTYSNAFSSWVRSQTLNPSYKQQLQFCNTSFLNLQALIQIKKTRQQLQSSLESTGVLSRLNQNFDLKLNQSSYAMISSALIAGVYPNILYRSESSLTIFGTIRQVKVNSSSIISSQEPGFYTYTSIQTIGAVQKDVVWELSRIPVTPVLIICGQLFEVNNFAKIASVDTDKFMVKCEGKEETLLLVLRQGVQTAIEHFIAGTDIEESDLLMLDSFSEIVETEVKSWEK